MANTVDNITAIILAGGQGSRFSNLDKGWIQCNNIPLIIRTIDSLSKQVNKILISANRNIEKYEELNYPVIADLLSNFQGPLAGIYACLNKAETDYCITCPCDSPLLIPNYVSLFNQVAENQPNKLIVAKGKTGLEPMFMLIPTHLQDSLNTYLSQGHRKALTWITDQDPLIIDFTDNPRGLLMFSNINTQQDLSFIENLLSQLSGNKNDLG